MPICHDVNNDKFPLRFCPAEPIPIRIAMCHLCSGTATWNHKNNTAPFWRLYWNSTDGASIWLDGIETRLKPSKVVLIAPETPFDKSTRRAVEHFHIHFYAGPLFDERIHRKIFTLRLRPDIKEAMNEMIQMLTNNRLDSCFFAKGTFVVSWALNNAEDTLPTTPVLDQRMALLYDYVGQNLGGVIETERLAHIAGMSISALIRYFKARTGESPQRFIMARRIEKACDLLHAPDANIDDVAARCGFCDRNYFSTVFTKLKGVGPGGYAKRRTM